MNTNNKPTDEELFPLPKGVKLRTHKFSLNPLTPLVAVPTASQCANEVSPRPMLTLRWEDCTLKLEVLVREDPATGRLLADVTCSDPAMLNKVWASVAIIGKDDDEFIRKSILLNQPGGDTGGCHGSADFGLLSDAIKLLGPELGLLVFRME